jgi:hypothetical protein
VPGDIISSLTSRRLPRADQAAEGESRMADRTLDRRARQWTRTAGRAITYGPFARLADWWCASRDARIVLPHLLRPAPGGPGDPVDPAGPGKPGAAPWTGSAAAASPVAPSAWDTPRTRFLDQLGRGRAEQEWLRYQKEVAGYLVGRTRALASRDAAERELQAAQQRLDRLAAPRDGELAARRSGEENTDLTVVASRRAAEFSAQREAAEAEVQRWSAERARHDLTVAALSEPVRMRFEVARHRAEMIDAYVWRRRAAYLTQLARRHADGPQAASVIHRGWPEHPAWAAAAASPDLAAPLAQASSPDLIRPPARSVAPDATGLMAPVSSPDLAGFPAGGSSPELAESPAEGTTPDLAGSLVPASWPEPPGFPAGTSAHGPARAVAETSAPEPAAASSPSPAESPAPASSPGPARPSAESSAPDLAGPAAGASGQQYLAGAAADSGGA